MTKSISLLLVLPLSVSFLTATACGGDGRPAANVNESQVGEPLDDSRINSAVQSKVFATDGLSRRNVEVTTMEGVVTLRGVVENEEVKRAALSVAAEAEGVKRVDDQLTIDPSWRARLELDGDDPAPTTGTSEGIAR